jgi:hypothetical protein
MPQIPHQYKPSTGTCVRNPAKARSDETWQEKAEREEVRQYLFAMPILTYSSLLTTPSPPDLSEMKLDEEGGTFTILDSEVKSVIHMKYPYDFLLNFVWHYIAAPVTEMHAGAANPSSDLKENAIKVLLAESSRRQVKKKEKLADVVSISVLTAAEGNTSCSRSDAGAGAGADAGVKAIPAPLVMDGTTLLDGGRRISNPGDSEGISNNNNGLGSGSMLEPDTQMQKTLTQASGGCGDRYDSEMEIRISHDFLRPDGNTEGSEGKEGQEDCREDEAFNPDEETFLVGALLSREGQTISHFGTDLTPGAKNKSVVLARDLWHQNVLGMPGEAARGKHADANDDASTVSKRGHEDVASFTGKRRRQHHLHEKQEQQEQQEQQEGGLSNMDVSSGSSKLTSADAGEDVGAGADVWGGLGARAVSRDMLDESRNPSNGDDDGKGNAGKIGGSGSLEADQPKKVHADESDGSGSRLAEDGGALRDFDPDKEGTLRANSETMSGSGGAGGGGKDRANAPAMELGEAGGAGLNAPLLPVRGRVRNRSRRRCGCMRININRYAACAIVAACVLLGVVSGHLLWPNSPVPVPMPTPAPASPPTSPSTPPPTSSSRCPADSVTLTSTQCLPLSPSSNCSECCPPHAFPPGTTYLGLSIDRRYYEYCTAKGTGYRCRAGYQTVTSKYCNPFQDPPKPDVCTPPDAYKYPEAPPGTYTDTATATHHHITPRPRFPVDPYLSHHHHRHRCRHHVSRR